MNEPQHHADAPMSMEEGVKALLCDAKQCFKERYEKCENRVRSSPIKAVVGAVAAGYLLHRLPVRSILVTQVRVLTALTPPALLLFGASKLYEYFCKPEHTLK